ncbi:hypothetical protein Mp_7g09400 [Marchantia polymorpha subsp. ruderalis]|uniref:Uncharacterized protein n=2 Tax=Marchantia polymorpha TaxID=3197 RepID=A0AAF6BXR8_MARPO|nr:hypothetical protein MARPO_0068s0093 [Marchantia polymorpha]BBN16802.1 hypothetical protein Mp_7g09400 [Marchantia polymorpha subsp. ruderalis]|eukprot:PTQ35884.1 hypothetical protein MARPO_0068s0093 [Marchantia polymorpha]
MVAESNYWVTVDSLLVHVNSKPKTHAAEAKNGFKMAAGSQRPGRLSWLSLLCASSRCDGQYCTGEYSTREPSGDTVLYSGYPPKKVAFARLTVGPDPSHRVSERANGVRGRSTGGTISKRVIDRDGERWFVGSCVRYFGRDDWAQGCSFSERQAKYGVRDERMGNWRKSRRARQRPRTRKATGWAERARERERERRKGSRA